MYNLFLTVLLALSAFVVQWSIFLCLTYWRFSCRQPRVLTWLAVCRAAMSKFCLLELEGMRCRRTKLVVWLALGAFVVQWSIFLRLTFWELSWDVMEPITYFTSSMFGIATYTYFIGTNREFGYKDATSHLRSRWEVSI